MGTIYQTDGSDSSGPVLQYVGDVTTSGRVARTTISRISFIRVSAWKSCPPASDEVVETPVADGSTKRRRLPYRSGGTSEAAAIALLMSTRRSCRRNVLAAPQSVAASDRAGAEGRVRREEARETLASCRLVGPSMGRPSARPATPGRRAIMPLPESPP